MNFPMSPQMAMDGLDPIKINVYNRMNGIIVGHINRRMGTVQILEEDIAKIFVECSQCDNMYQTVSKGWVDKLIEEYRGAGWEIERHDEDVPAVYLFFVPDELLLFNPSTKF